MKNSDDSKNYAQQHKAWAKIVAKAWSDELFKQRLMKNPAVVLKENGIPTQSGDSYVVHENTHKVHHLVIPEKPSGNLTEDQIMRISGGSCTKGSCADNPTTCGCTSYNGPLLGPDREPGSTD